MKAARGVGFWGVRWDHPLPTRGRAWGGGLFSCPLSRTNQFLFEIAYFDALLVVLAVPLSFQTIKSHATLYCKNVPAS